MGFVIQGSVNVVTFFFCSLDQDGKEKIQFSMNLATIANFGTLFQIHLEKEGFLDIGLSRSGRFFIELSGQRLTQPTALVPNHWHKISISKQHHRLSLKVDQHQEILILDKSWPGISLNTDLKFTEIAQGQVCLRNYHVIRWKNGRKSKSISNDICK